MLTITAVIAIGSTLAVLAVAIAIRRAIETGWRYRGPHVVTCPENACSAAVRVDTAHAAGTALAGTPELRLEGCSRWPERAGCGQQCLAQLEDDPEACRVGAILTQWHEGKYCVGCGQPVSRAYWTPRSPALLTPEGSREWSEIPEADLPRVLSTAQPLCFRCHVRRELGRGPERAGSHAAVSGAAPR